MICRPWMREWTHLARPGSWLGLWRLQGPCGQYGHKVLHLCFLLQQHKKKMHRCLGGIKWQLQSKKHRRLSAQLRLLHLWCHLWMWRRSRCWLYFTSTMFEDFGLKGQRNFNKRIYVDQENNRFKFDYILSKAIWHANHVENAEHCWQGG